jgi:molybdate transport system substrate-binding protein
VSRDRARLAVGLLAAIVALAGCAPQAAATPPIITVLAASSLKNAVQAAATAYAKSHGNIGVTVSTDASTALETQIEQDAPADLFLSADTANPEKLADAGFGVGTPTDFAGNRLTIIVPADNPAGITSPVDLAKPGIKLIAAGDSVPITKYATQLVTNLAAVSGYPADFAAAYARNIVSKADNVAGVVSQVELGQGDAAIVYVTDAAATSKVRTIPVPDAANVAATYAGIVVKASSKQTEAKAFLDWLVGPDGQALLATFGFLPPPS